MGRAGFRGAVPLRSSGFRATYNSRAYIPSNGNRFSAGRAPYNPARAGRAGGRDRNRFDRRRREFNNWYSYNYPYWLGYGYPYVIDPGFYDWDDTDSGDSEQPSAYDQGGNGYDQSGAAPAYPLAYPEEGYRSPYQPATAPAAIVTPLPDQPLTVIFKDGRVPVKMQNYMMTATVLTDLDAQHYEQIPLDQVDLAATQWANSAAGVKFQVPSAVRD